MGTSTPTKSTSVQTAVALQELTAAPRQTHSPDINVATAWAASFWIRIGRIVTAALTLPVTVRIEGSPSASGDDDWQVIASLQSGTAAAESEALTATEPVGEVTLAMASTTNLAAADPIYIKNLTVANSEFRRICNVAAGVSITIEDGLRCQQDAANSVVFDQADIFPALTISTEGYKRLRVYVDGCQAGQNFAVDAKYILFESVAT